MTGSRTLTLALLLTCSHSAFAQQPPRPNETPRAVTLSLTEYNRLIDLASRPPQGALVAPVAAVLASANLRVRVERDTARGVFAIAGDALRPGVSRVSLLSGATLIDANAGGRPLPLIADGNAHTALIPGPGPFSLSLEWGAPLQFKPGRASFVLPVPQAGTARATFDLPGDQADVHLSSGLITGKSILDGRTIIEATLDPGSSTEVWWSMRDSAPTAAARELRALADVMTLITIGDSDVRMVALIDVSVVQGELRTAAVRLPAGYEVTGISGSSLETSEPVDGGLILTVGNPAARSHQFLVSLERPHDGGSFSVDTGFVSVRDVQRERGEVAIEGVGTLELTVDERDPMHRIDVRELNQALQLLARLPVLTAFRYQRSAGPAPALALEVKRFADAGVLAAIADRAVATTLVTSEGRALTEVVLTVQNRAQPFLKVTLPPGASMVSVDVAGQPAKPVQGTDGIRVPLLRPGFRPTGSYQVSFVYLHAGTPFAKKGDIEMTLPKMDLPVGIVQWELFAPERYSMRTIGGNVMDVKVLERLASSTSTASSNGVAGGVVGSLPAAPPPPRGAGFGFSAQRPGRISVTGVDGPARLLTGRVVDESGAVLPGVTIEVATMAGLRTVITDLNGAFAVSDVLPGPVTVTATLPGFSPARSSFNADERTRRLDISLPVGGLTETMSVTVVGETPLVDVQRAVATPPSQNVVDLQRKATGVLPVRIDVPRAGTSHQFIKPLVVDQETVVRLRYKRR